jgi:hypothetical protein
MFNRGKFNRQPYNKKINIENDIYFKARISEFLYGIGGKGTDFYVKKRLTETLSAQNTPTMAHFISKIILEELSSSIEVSAGLYAVAQILEELTGSAAMAADYSPPAKIGEDLNGGAKISAYYYPSLSALQELSASGRIASDNYSYGGMFEVLDGVVSAHDTETAELNISGSIPVGGVLVIDSEYYTVTLNNQNAVDRHSGDWIFVDRDSESLEVSAAGISGINMEVAYIAKYL